MSQYGLIGYPLQNTFSKTYFEQCCLRDQLGQHSYDNFPIESVNALETFLQQTSGNGFNITQPYKTAILPYLSELSEEAASVGAVNCIQRTAKGWKGFNTDVWGFEKAWLAFVGNALDKHYKAVLIGNGGAAKAAAYVLQKHQIEYRYKKRNDSGEIGQDEIYLIQCTPLGMAPNTEAFPEIAYKQMDAKHWCYDMIYTPEETTFLRKCREQGAHTCHGLGMLHAQADKSREIWFE